MPVCWFCGEDVPDVTKCPKCGLEYCELHVNQHDCPGAPVQNPFKILIEPRFNEENIEIESSRPSPSLEENLEKPNPNYMDIQSLSPEQKTSADAIFIEGFAELEKLHIQTLADLTKFLDNILPLAKYTPMVEEILSTEKATILHLQSNFNDKSIKMIGTAMIQLAKKYQEKYKLSREETYDLANALLISGGPKIFPESQSPEEKRTRVMFILTGYNFIITRKAELGRNG